MMECYEVSSGVTSTGLILNNDYELSVYSGGTAIGTVFRSGRGRAIAYNGGLLISNFITPNAVMELIGDTSASVIYAGGTLYARGGYDYETYGGSSALIDRTSVYGNFDIQGGYEDDAFATANHTDVYSGGEMTVFSGCSALNTNIYLGGSIFVDFKGTASNTVADGGIMRVDGGASAVGITAKNRGIVKLSGDAEYVTVSSGGAVFVLGGAVAENITVNGGGVFVATGGEIKGNISISQSGGLYLYGGSIMNGEIHVKGTLYVDETMVNNGQITVSLNSASPVMASIQNLDYMTGTTNIMVDTADSAEGSYLLADNAAAYDGVVTLTKDVAELGTLTVGSSFTKDNVTYSLACNSGNLALNIAGASSGPVISGSSSISDATITNATVINGGILYLENRGIANHTTIASDGGMYVSYGGTANSTIMNDTYGWMEVYNGGVVNNTLISIGDVTIFSGGTANGTTISSGYLGIESGGTANNTILNGGSDHLYAPTLCISNGGIANSTTVNSAGSMCVSSGGILKGKIQIEAGACVSAYQGAIIDFTVAEQTIPSTTLINNWSLIQGRNDADYTLTVRANQVSGTYTLATGAADFNKTLTVKTDGNIALGTLAVGESKVLGKSNYTLSQSSDTLALTVTSPAVSDYNRSSRSDMIQFVNGLVYVTHDTESGYVQTDAVNDITGWNVTEIRRDLTGDGFADIQITADAGDGTTWVATLRNDYLQTGCITLNYQFIGAYDNRLWSYLGSADFNGDGKSEILMVQTEAGKDPYGHRNVAGWVTDEESCQWIDNIWLGALNDGWNIAGTADVTGDGKDNVILRGADGMIGYWSEFGGMPEDIVTLKNAGNRVLITTGDFDGDGVQDFLWQSCDNGEFSTWTNISNSLIDTVIGKTGDLGGSWTFAGTGDCNGDRKDELLWCDTSTYRTAYSEANKENFTNLTVIA